MLYPDYDPRFVEFLMVEGIREHLRMETVGHTGPYGEDAIRREMGEVFADRHNWQSETALTTAAPR